MVSLFRRGLWAAATLWSAAAQAAPLPVDDVVRQALALHPDAVAARAEVGAAEARRREVSTFLENPEAQVGVAAIGSLVQGTVNQPISLAGEGWHARRAGRAAADGAAHLSRRADLEVAAAARALYAAAITTRDRWGLADHGLAQATRLREAVEARAKVGEAGPLDVRLARLAEADATSAAITARRDHARVRAALAVFAPIAVEAELAADARAALPGGAAPAPRSDVEAAAVAVRGAEARRKEARAAAIPKLGLGMFFQIDQGHGDPGDVGPQVTVGIPLWTRNQGAVGEAEAGLSVAQARHGALVAQAQAEAQTTAEAAQYADNALARLGDFDSDAKAALSAIELGWTSGEFSLANAVLLRREVLDGWSAALEARQATVEARLDALLATDDATLLGAP